MTPEELEQKALNDYREILKKAKEEEISLEIEGIKKNFPDAEYMGEHKWKLGTYIFDPGYNIESGRYYLTYPDYFWIISNMVDFGKFLHLQEVSKTKQNEQMEITVTDYEAQKYKLQGLYGNKKRLTFWSFIKNLFK